MAKTFGEYADFLGVKFPDGMEEGDVITDIVALVVVVGDAGEQMVPLLSEGTSGIKAEGMIVTAFREPAFFAAVPTTYIEEEDDE